MPSARSCPHGSMTWKPTRERQEARRTPRTERSGGASWRVRSVAILTAASRPDQVVRLAVLCIEQVGVDGGVEARIVELDGEVVAALVGAFGPDGPDLGPANEDPVRGRAVVGPVGFGDDADAPRL